MNDDTTADAGRTAPMDRDRVLDDNTPAAAGGRPAGGGAPGIDDDAVAAVKDPDNRARLLLGIAAVTVLNLLLLIIVLTQTAGDHDVVNVPDRGPCIIADHEGNPTLFCAEQG